jgi:exopolyphosphatase / guanosine-5'-triphosphate,3'-diphosphate pyrophosphatase
LKLATIDVGTNTTLLLVAEGESAADVTVLADRAEVTRLGRGIGAGGRLGDEGIARTLAVLSEYAGIARRHGAEIVAVGTEALRRAPNAAEFLRPAAEILGAPVQVIDGDREAALSFLAAARSFPAVADDTVAVVDIGGGSTEVIIADRGALQQRISLPLGSVRLTERHLRRDPPAPDEVAAMAAEIDAALDAVRWPASSGALIGIAGTVTSLGAMAQRLASYDASLVHGYHLTLATLEDLVAGLEASTQAAREQMAGLDPRRADVIFAGAWLLLAIARRVGVGEVLVSDRGIRWGLIYERFSPAA